MLRPASNQVTHGHAAPPSSFQHQPLDTAAEVLRVSGADVVKPGLIADPEAWVDAKAPSNSNDLTKPSFLQSQGGVGVKSRPLAGNLTRQGRKQNRRFDFHIEN